MFRLLVKLICHLLALLIAIIAAFVVQPIKKNPPLVGFLVCILALLILCVYFQLRERQIANMENLLLLIPYIYFELCHSLLSYPFYILDKWIILAIGLGFFLQLFNKTCPIIFIWNSLFLVLGFIIRGIHLWFQKLAEVSNPISCILYQPQELIHWLIDTRFGILDYQSIWHSLSMNINWIFILSIGLVMLLWLSRPKSQKNIKESPLKP